MTRAFLGTCSALFVLAGCSDPGAGGDPPPQPSTKIQGGLSRATFTYACTGAGDAQCDSDADLAPVRTSSPFPPIAVGGTFQLTSASLNYADLTVEPVSPDFLAATGDGRSFTAKRAGVMSVTATQNHVPVDFANIELVEPTHLKLLQARPDGDFRGVDIDFTGKGISFNENQQFTFKFRAVAVNDKDEILAGALPCMWATSDEAIAKITSDPVDNIVTVVSGAAGTAIVSVDYGAFHGTVSVEVGQ